MFQLAVRDKPDNIVLMTYMSLFCFVWLEVHHLTHMKTSPIPVKKCLPMLGTHW